MSHPTEGAEALRVGRSYTRARRFPWVIGQIQGWTIPLGPFTATQLGVLIGGLFLVVKSFPLWGRLGPAALVVIAAPFAATWAVRHAKIAGRTPLRALAGYASLLTEPACGRIAGRAARDRRPVRLTGRIRLTAVPGGLVHEAALVCHPAHTSGPAPAGVPAEDAASPPPTDRHAGRRPPHPNPAGSTVAVGTARPAPSGLQSLLSTRRPER